MHIVNALGGDSTAKHKEDMLTLLQQKGMAGLNGAWKPNS